MPPTKWSSRALDLAFRLSYLSVLAGSIELLFSLVFLMGTGELGVAALLFAMSLGLMIFGGALYTYIAPALYNEFRCDHAEV